VHPARSAVIHADLPLRRPRQPIGAAAARVSPLRQELFIPPATTHLGLATPPSRGFPESFQQGMTGLGQAHQIARITECSTATTEIP